MKLFSGRNAPSPTFFNQDQDTGTTPSSRRDKLPESQGVSDKQNPSVTSTDPGTVTIPPAEGRTDIGAEQANQAPDNQDPGATTATTHPAQPELLSKQPSEGRSDVAEDLEKEQRDAYSAHHPTPSSQREKRSKPRKKKK